MYRRVVVLEFSQLRHIAFKLILFFAGKEVHRRRKNSFIAQIRDVANTVVVECLAFRFHLLRLGGVTHVFVVLLSDVLEEFTHLLGCQFICVVLPTARTVFVVLSGVSSQNSLNDLLKLGI